MVVELIYCIKLPKRFQNHTQQRQGGTIEIKHISNPDFFSSLISQCFSFFNSRNTFYHPFGSWCAFKIVIKKTKHSGTQVHSVCPILILDIMIHSVIIDEPNRFLKPIKRHKKLNPLIPGHCTIVIVGHNQQRSFYIRCHKKRRVLDVVQGFIPKRTSDSALRFLILKHSAHSGSPTNSAISRTTSNK